MSFRFRVLGSGSSGNSTLVEGGGTRLLLDAGLGPKELAERLQSVGVDPASLHCVFLSHEHTDHIKGAASFSRRWGVPLCGSRGTYAASGLGATEIASYDVIEGGATRLVGSLRVRAVRVPHDAAEPLAFVVSMGALCLGHATDLGHIGPGLVSAFSSCQAMLLESNYDGPMLRDGPYPWSLKERILSPLGHLSNSDVAGYLRTKLPSVCETVTLAHLSRKNNHPDLVLMAAEGALRRGGRTDVRLLTTEPEGSGWIVVGREGARVRDGGQLRLF